MQGQTVVVIADLERRKDDFFEVFGFLVIERLGRSPSEVRSKIAVRSTFFRVRLKKSIL
jgi:hypothetical protein